MSFSEGDEQRCRQYRYWLEAELPRKLIKECVMPVIYGRRHQSMVEVIATHLRNQFDDFLIGGDRIFDLAQRLAHAISLSVKDDLPLRMTCPTGSVPSHRFNAMLGRSLIG